MLCSNLKVAEPEAEFAKDEPAKISMVAVSAIVIDERVQPASLKAAANTGVVATLFRSVVTKPVVAVSE